MILSTRWEWNPEVEKKLARGIERDNETLRDLLKGFFTNGSFDKEVAKATYLESVTTDEGEKTWDEIEPYLGRLKKQGARDVSLETEIVIRYVTEKEAKIMEYPDIDMVADIATEVKFVGAEVISKADPTRRHRRDCAWF